MCNEKMIGYYELRTKMTTINTPLIKPQLLVAYEKTSADVKLEFSLIFKQTCVVEK